MQASRLSALTLLALGAVIQGNASATTLVLESDASTLAAATPLDISLLDSGDISGLLFSPVAVGSFGTFTPVPTGAPVTTQVVNIAPGDGESGFFRVDFTLPVGFSTVTLSGAANADDIGRVFVNGTALTPNLNTSGQVDEFDGVTFTTADASLFHAGVNTLLVSDANTGGGPSGASFFANVSYVAAVPEPQTWALMCAGVAIVAGLSRRRR